MHIFDMDGTLIDSNGIWREVDEAFLAKRGFPYTKEYYQGVAHTIFPLAAEFTKRYCHLEESVEDIMAEWMEMAGDAYATRVQVKPGVREYLDQCRRRGQRMMVLTSSVPAHCRAALGHLGLMPQSINKYGTYTVRAKDDAEAEKLVRDAHLLEEAGCFAIVLEKIPAELAERVASELTIPIIGIGAGSGVDGQVLVIQDMLGMNNGFRPRFLRRYADLHTIMTDAISRYISDVKNLDFPNEKEQY